MKKIFASFLLVVAVAGMTSCTEEITRNSPALEGMKDDVRWRARASEATLSVDGTLTIVGLTQFETLTLTVPSAAPGTYVIGADGDASATYLYEREGAELFYTTDDEEGDGEIVIEEYDTAKQTVSGTFRFNAINVASNPLGGHILNYQYGTFYKVPVVPGL